MDVALGLLVLRVVAGLTFAAHGAQKTFGWWEGPGMSGWRTGIERMGIRPAPFWAVVSAGVELFGGLLLALGLLTPLAAAALVGQSIVILLHVHLAKGFWNRVGGIEFPLALGVIPLALIGTGPGSISLDAALGLVFSPQVRLILLAIGVIGGLVAVAIPRMASRGEAAVPGSR